MLKLFHIALAYLTVLGFVVRGIWALTDWEKLPEERRIDREEKAELPRPWT